jgi:hypothetical protein
MKARLLSVGGTVLACLLAVSPLQAQEKGDMHRLVVYNGSARTVQYYGNDAAAVRDRSRRENEESIADLVHDLRVQYVRNERVMEHKRHQMQMLLYGYSTTYGYSIFPSGVFDGGYRGLYGGWGWGYGGGYPAGLGTTTHSLQNGIGDEGALKRDLIQGLIAPPAEKKP